MPSPERSPRHSVSAHLSFLGYATAQMIHAEGTERYLRSQGAHPPEAKKELTPEEYAEQVRRFHDQKTDPEQVSARRRYITPRTILPAGFSHDDTGEEIGDVPPWAEH